jgi:hypothetical protein
LLRLARAEIRGFEDSADHALRRCRMPCDIFLIARQGAAEILRPRPIDGSPQYHTSRLSSVQLLRFGGKRQIGIELAVDELFERFRGGIVDRILPWVSSLLEPAGECLSASFETRSCEAPLRMRSYISMVSLTLRRSEGPSRRVLIEESGIFPHPVRLVRHRRCRPASFETVDRAKAVIASEAKQSRGDSVHPGRDCFVASGASQ